LSAAPHFDALAKAAVSTPPTPLPLALPITEVTEEKPVIAVTADAADPKDTFEFFDCG
jgi:hypothetical protein